MSKVQPRRESNVLMTAIIRFPGAPAISFLQTDSWRHWRELPGERRLDALLAGRRRTLRGPMPPGSSLRTDCRKAQPGTHTRSDGSCDSGIFQKCIAYFTQGVFKII